MIQTAALIQSSAPGQIGCGCVALAIANVERVLVWLSDDYSHSFGPVLRLVALLPLAMSVVQFCFLRPPSRAGR